MANPPSPGSSSSNVSVEELDDSIKEQVQAAVTRFAGVLVSEQSDSEFLEADELRRAPSSLDGRRTALERLDEEKRSYEDQLAKLQEEVELLDDEMRRREEGVTYVETDGEMEGALFGLARSSVQKDGERGIEGVATSRKHEKAIRNLKARIRLNEAFSGIQFTSAEHEIVAKDAGSVHCKHVHTGSSYGFEFKVEFIVREESTGSGEGESPDLARIIALSTSVDPRIAPALQAFITRVCMDFDLMKFYQTYVKYAILVNERRDVFSTAKSNYRNSIDIPDGVEGTRMNFRLKNGLSLFFTWSVSVSERGFVDNSLGLQVKSHSRASDEDRETVSHLPRLLQKMVQVKGHREAFLSVLALLHPTIS